HSPMALITLLMGPPPRLKATPPLGTFQPALVEPQATAVADAGAAARAMGSAQRDAMTNRCSIGGPPPKKGYWDAEADRLGSPARLATGRPAHEDRAGAASGAGNSRAPRPGALHGTAAGRCPTAGRVSGRVSAAGHHPGPARRDRGVSGAARRGDRARDRGGSGKRTGARTIPAPATPPLTPAGPSLRRREAPLAAAP